ncbi:MAG: DUF3365 domain-containing protein [Nitrospiraceae bacterium]
MRGRTVPMLASLALLAILIPLPTYPAEPSRAVTLPVEAVADYVHAVIEAHRTFYTLQVVERLQQHGTLVASENWRAAHTLPLPAQFLRETSDLASLTGTRIRYRLIGLWPINRQNAPATEAEKAGLQQVQEHPEQPHTRLTTDGTERYFEAIYADRAVAQACIGCHNAHPNSPKHDFKAGEVMGAIVIQIPLEP